MYLNNIDFPNQILDAILENKLVVFAGAGASMGKPTSLPDFLELAEKIAEGTGKTIKQNEPCEVFLGALKAGGVDVNGDAAKILSSACLKHNDLHETIVDLFLSPSNLKIVTTNYDQMFEQVLEERSINIPVYNSPALPLGNDITGIIHIHGNVEDPKYMVVTDEDFGRAYLTDGYAARFLVRLFESYTILFIGYSYNDTILRYLTRAMSRENASNRYILTDDTKSDWKSLGISPVFFPRKKYPVMCDGLVKLGQYAKRGLWDWKNQFAEFAEKPPKDLTFDTEIDYCLESLERSKVLSGCIRGTEWLQLLDRKGVFSFCYSEERIVDEKGFLWANWLCNTFVGYDDNSVKQFLAEHDNKISNMFAKLLLKKIILENNSVDHTAFREYLTLFDRYIVDPWIISKSIEVANEHRLYHLCLHLFEKYFVVSMKVGKKLWLAGEVIEPVHSFAGSYYLVQASWKLISNNVIPRYAMDIISFVRQKIEDLHYQYVELGAASDNKEPWSIAMLEIESCNPGYGATPLHILVQAFIEAVIELKNNDEVKLCLLRCLNSESIILRKIAIKGIRDCLCINYDEIIDLLCDKKLIWFIEGKEQVFLLAKEAFTKASAEKQAKLLDLIEHGPIDYNENVSQYEKYNWFVWLHKVAPQNERIESSIKYYENEYHFKPREHPERNIESSGFVWTTEKSPVTTEEMQEMPIPQLASMLAEYRENSFDGPTRWGLLRTFCNSIKANLPWARTISDYLCTNKSNDLETWRYLFIGLEESNLTIEEAFSFCKQFSGIVDILPDEQVLAYFLYVLLQKEGIQGDFSRYEKDLFELSLKLWNRRSRKDPGQQRLIDETFNTTTGILLLCWIRMAAYSSTTSITNMYKARFEEALNLSSWERTIAIFTLAGHFSFLCYRDRAWYISHFEPVLTGKNEEDFPIAWEGMVHFSQRVSKDTADIMAPIILKAVRNITYFGEETRDEFLELYLTFLIFVVDTPITKYIPALYQNSTEETIIRFVKTVQNRLSIMDNEAKTKWWRSWLKQFIENRKSNKPTELLEHECGALFMLLPELDFATDEAIAVLCIGRLPTIIDELFWLEINKKDLSSKHSQSTAMLLIKLLGSITDIEIAKDWITPIIRKLHDLPELEYKQLQEVLLKHNLSTSLI